MTAQSVDLGVIGILGTSFSGSTLLNLMLGAHPKIHAGGELSALVLSRGDESASSCTACGFACRYWNDAARAAVTKANLYREVERIFGKGVIVDSSKSIAWFGETLASDEHRGVSVSYVLMVKHPVRYLASCLANMTPHRPRRRTVGLFDKLSSGRQRQAFLDELVEDLDAFYGQFFWSFGKSVGNATFHLMHYERMVADPRAALAPLLRSLALTFAPEMGDFFHATYHQIGGNAGPLYQLGQGWPKGTRPNDVRQRFYERGAGLRIDDKYRQLLSDSELTQLLLHPTVRKLCDQLGYDDPRMPFPVS
jgi:hypothetical protein